MANAWGVNMNWLKQSWNRAGLYFVLLTPILLLFVFNPVFRQPGNLFNLWQQSAIIGLIAVGQTLVIILGGFDLSVGAVAALAGVLCYLSFGALDSPLGLALGIAAALAGCGVVGIVNGLLVTKLRITPLIATLGVLSLVRGFVLVASDGRLVYAEGYGYALSEFIQGSLWHMPVAGLLFLLLAAFLTFVLRGTVFGQYVFAIGGNEKAAILAGLPVNGIKVATYALCSILAGIGGIVLAARTASALPNAGINYELQAITAAVIGGATLGGGRGSIPGTVAGVLLLTAIGNGLNLYNVSAFWQTAVTGAILLIAVGISMATGREAER